MKGYTKIEKELKKQGYEVEYKHFQHNFYNLLAKKAPDRAIRSKNTRGIWNADSEIWCDPTNKKVQDCKTPVIYISKIQTSTKPTFLHRGNDRPRSTQP